jgi:hypothetical protein
MYSGSLKWEEIVYYLYTEYDYHQTQTYEDFKNVIIRETDIEDEETVEEVLDFAQSVGLVNYGDKVEYHPLTTKGFDVGRELHQNEQSIKRRKFNMASQTTTAVMTFFLGLSAVAQIATLYNIDNSLLTIILSVTIIVLIGAIIAVYTR